MSSLKKFILPTIVVAQFCCTSLWFAGNAILDDLIINYNLPENSIAGLTSIVQFGFISGTLLFAILTISDRFSPAKVFFACAILGAFFNLLIINSQNTFNSILLLRFLTGFFLAGIYPVGMKIASDYYKKGLGKALGFLVGSLVLGTAFPHLLKDLNTGFPWKNVVIFISILSILGGLLILFLGDGKNRKQSQQFNFSAFFDVFRNDDFRSAAFGYFGHMWELYAFWAFVPVLIKMFANNNNIDINIPLFSFLIIAIGALGCVVSGYLSLNFKTKKVAFYILLSSFICCLISPLIFQLKSSFIFLSFLFFWGFVVIADSPLFSTLVVNNAEAKIKGTALTIVNCIGFTITIISIQLLSILISRFNTPMVFTLLAIGPLFGILSLQVIKKKRSFLL